MARSGRRILSPHRRHANAREAAMTAIRAMPDSSGLLLSLRQRWDAVQLRTTAGGKPVSPKAIALFTPLGVLDRIQRGPHDPDLQTDRLVWPSDELRLYLNKLDEITAQHLHLTDQGTPARWIREDLHRDPIKDAPPDWWERVDLWRFEAPAPAPELRIATQGFGVRVTQHDPETGELVATQVFSDLGAAQKFFDDTITRHQQAQGWQRNPASETKMLEQDIPTLMRWYVAGDCPADEPTRRRLQDLARDVLMLDPPRKTRANFFADLAKNRGYSDGDE